MKYGWAQGRASILIAIPSSPPFRRPHIKRSLCTEVRNEEPVAATERPDSPAPSRPSTQKHARARQDSAQPWQSTKCVKFYDPLHYPKGNAAQAQSLLGFVQVLTSRCHHFSPVVSTSLAGITGRYGCWLHVHAVPRTLQKHHAVGSCSALGLFVFPPKRLVWGSPTLFVNEFRSLQSEQTVWLSSKP